MTQPTAAPSFDGVIGPVVQAYGPNGALQPFVAPGFVALSVTGEPINPGAIDGGTIYSGGTALTPKFAPIAESSSGANEVIAAVTAKKIRVLSFNLMASAAVNAKWQSAATDLTGLSYFSAAGGGISVPFNPLGLFETLAGEALNLNLSGAVAVGGSLVYVEV